LVCTLWISPEEVEDFFGKALPSAPCSNTAQQKFAPASLKMRSLPSAEEVVEKFCAAYENNHGPCPSLALEKKMKIGDEHFSSSDCLNGHEYTRLVCRVSLQEVDFEPEWKCEWRIQRRVCTIREDLHGPLKLALGQEEYEKFFHPDFPFVRQGGVKVPGNVPRLENWLLRLAKLVSERKIPDSFVREVLKAVVKPSFSEAELAEISETPWCMEQQLPQREASEQAWPSPLTVGKSEA